MIYDLCSFICVFFVSNMVLVLRGGWWIEKKIVGGGGRRWGGSPRAPYRLAPPLHQTICVTTRGRLFKIRTYQRINNLRIGHCKVSWQFCILKLEAIYSGSNNYLIPC